MTAADYYHRTEKWTKRNETSTSNGKKKLNFDHIRKIYYLKTRKNPMAR